MTGRLLIVEDEVPIQQLLRIYFRARGYEVDAAGELDEARRLLQTHTYQVVLSDVSLSGGPSGREGLQLLKEARQLSAPPGVIVLTALELSAQELAASAQPDVLLRKPLRLATVASHVERLIAASVPSASCA